MCIDAIRIFNSVQTLAKALPGQTGVAAAAPVAPAQDCATDTDTAQRQITESVDDGKHVIHRVLDGKTGRIICQVPSEEVLRVGRNLERLAHPDEPQQIDSKV
jgi:hypothetical protein